MLRVGCLLGFLACAGPSTVPGNNPTGASGSTGAHTGPSGATYADVNPGGTVQMGPVTAPSGVIPVNEDPTPATLYGNTYTTLRLEIAYQPNAAPYVGQVPPYSDIWQIFADNSQALFQSRKSVSFPNTLNEMHQLPAGTQMDYTLTDILDLMIANRQDASGHGVAAFYVVFLNGYFSQDGVRQSNVLGISIGGTMLIALFKPVIASTGGGLFHANDAKYVEQATLVHEFGHAIGLVNNGVAMMAPHQDSAHGKHCSNKDCGMYWANEGAGAGTAFLSQYFGGGSTILFDDACLNDVHAAH